MKNTKKMLNKGFSLVEMLVVIAVIGIIAAIAVPNIGRINESAKDATNRRNAQSIASVFASAQAAGLNFYDAASDTTTLNNVITGGTVTETGPFKGTFFGVPGLSTADRDLAVPYLTFDDTSKTVRYVAVKAGDTAVAP